jgi:hypothetical protein
MPVIAVIAVYTCYSKVVKLKKKTVSNFKEIGRNSVTVFQMYIVCRLSACILLQSAFMCVTKQVNTYSGLLPIALSVILEMPKYQFSFFFFFFFAIGNSFACLTGTSTNGCHDETVPS